MQRTDFLHFFGGQAWTRVLVLALTISTILVNCSQIVDEDVDGEVDTSPQNGGSCIDKKKQSSEDFLMKLNLCRKNVSITCQIGGNAECHKDREAFKATAIISKSMTQCLIEANTTELKYIRFVIKAKYLRNLNELGSRGLQEEPEIQRGRCTLGYTCIDHHYLKEIRVNCFAFHYDMHETPSNGTSKKFVWDAPKNYQGSVYFKSTVKVSYASFFVDVDTAKVLLPAELKAKKA